MEGEASHDRRAGVLLRHLAPLQLAPTAAQARARAHRAVGDEGY